MKPLFVGLALVAAAVAGYFYGRQARPAPASPAVASLRSPDHSTADSAEIARLREENAELNRRVETQKLQIPMVQTTAVVGPPSVRLTLDPRGNGLSRSSLESLGLTREEADRGNPLLDAAISELRKLELDHMDEPVIAPGVVMLRIAPFEEQSQRVLTKLIDDLAAVWNPAAIERLRITEPRRLLSSIGGGFGDRLVTIRPMDDPNEFSVSENVTRGRSQSSSTTSMTAEQLRRRFGISPPIAGNP